MKITKLVHSCLLIEMPSPINRTALFDPGSFSTINIDSLEFLDDIFITHNHGDHYDSEIVGKLVAKFPNVRITAPQEVIDDLQSKGITASAQPPEGATLFDSPHEVIRPLYPSDPPQEIGVHYLEKLSHPGDSHSFTETKAILALPVQAPWGSSTAAVKLALELKPKYIVPIHDWHWSTAARESTYDAMEQVFAGHGIKFLKVVNGEPVIVEV